jgi:hypothetical protein
VAAQEIQTQGVQNLLFTGLEATRDGPVTKAKFLADANPVVPVEDGATFIDLHRDHASPECNVLSEGIELLFAERREDLEGS